MIRHIFLKDLRRLWPFVAGLAVLHFALAVVLVKVGVFPQDHETLDHVADLLDGVCNLMVFFIAVMAVQLDPLPDDRQDWLVRPIRRSDLILAKLLFVVLLVHGPLLAANLLQGLMSGFPPGQALAAAVSWNLYHFVSFTLPALAIAALTRTIGQMLGLGFAIVAGVALTIAAVMWARYAMNGADPDTGSTLVGWLLKNAFFTAGAIVILGLQYFRRETVAGRAVMAVCTLLGAAAMTLLPQSTALAMQNWLPMRGQQVALSFAPEAKPASGAPEARASSQIVPVRLPLRVEGLAPDLMLVSEGVRVTLTAPDGKSVTVSDGQDDTLHLPGQPMAPFHQRFDVPRDFYRAHAGQPVRVEMQYVLGVLTPNSRHELPAIGGALQLPQGARCATRLTPNDQGVLFNCLQAGQVHLRVSAALKDRMGTQQAWNIRHLPSDAPWSHGADMITRFGFVLPLREGEKPAAIAVTVSQPLAHVSRHIVIEGVRLRDWATP